MNTLRPGALPRALATLCLGLVAAAHATDTSSIVSVSGGYNARDVVTDILVTGGYSVSNGTVHVWTDDMFNGGYLGYRTAQISTGLVTDISRPSTQHGNGYGDAFGLYDSSSSTFYAGYYSGSEAGVLRYANGAWQSLGIFQSLYGATVHDGDLYVSGLNQIWTGSTGQDNQIALFDLTGGNQHDVIIQATGNSAQVAVDAQGNVYYANYGSTPGLYRWSFEDINLVRADKGGGLAGGGEDDLFLTINDAVQLTALPDGANGIAVDEAGNVFVTVNGNTSSLLMWNDSMGLWSNEDAFHFDLIAGLDESLFYGWFGALAATGNFLDGGAIYLSNYGSNGLAEITSAVPEPSVAALLILGTTALIARRRYHSTLRA